MIDPLPSSSLPAGIRARFLRGVNGLDVHVLEAGHEPSGRPCVLLLHGFPELAYSWRKVLLALAQAGYHAIAPDQRGYGRTTGWDARYSGDLASYRVLNLVRDAIGVVRALGYQTVEAVVGHDFGVTVASYATLLRPDIFRRMVLMSGPFAGPPPIDPTPPRQGPDIHTALAALPRPRKHYQWYYSTAGANDDMWKAPQGMHAFLRAYFHHKSADWKANRPFPLKSWTADELAKMPTYYIMDLADDMPATVAKEMPSPAEITNNTWLTEAELAVYSGEFERTGFQGGLQWYRVQTGGRFNGELEIFAGRTIDVPSLFIAGKSDWGVFQRPGALQKMRDSACTNFKGAHMLEGAGHWVQQERADGVNRLLLEFFRGT